MADPVWKITPKLKPEFVDEHARFIEELAEAKAEMKSIGAFAKLLSRKKDKRHRELKAKVATREKQIKACVAPVGRDLDPPRIGMDDRATKWYRKHLSRAPEAWPLPPDEMVEEMHGAPVWELSKHKEVQHLDVGWPDGGFPVPRSRAFSLELSKQLSTTLTGEQALEAATALELETFDYMRSAIPGLEEAQPRQLIDVIVRGRAPSRPAGDPTEATIVEARAAVSAMSWLRFWGGHGYGFTFHLPSGG